MRWLLISEDYLTLQPIVRKSVWIRMYMYRYEQCLTPQFRGYLN